MDPAALQDLGAQLENPAVAKGFARDYARMWDQRYRSLASALERGDLAGSMDAVLSLKTSSAMVGGLRLAQLAGELENALRAGDMGRALSLLLDVAAARRGNRRRAPVQLCPVGQLGPAGPLPPTGSRVPGAGAASGGYRAGDSR